MYSIYSCIKYVLIIIEVYPASQIYINGPHPDKLKQSSELKDCNICSLSDLIETSNVIVLSVKPNIFMSTVLNDLNKLLSTKSAKSAFDNKIFISLLAGVTLNALSNKLVSIKNTILFSTRPQNRGR